MRTAGSASTVNYDVAVIGGGMSGMATAARVQSSGLSTVVLEAHGHLGGCAGYYRKREFSFDVGATTLVDFQAGGVGDELLTGIGMPALDADPLPGYRAWLPDRQVTLYRDTADWHPERLRAFGDTPVHRAFWTEFDRIAEVFWAASQAGVRLPLRRPADALHNLQAVGLRNLPLVRHLNATLGDLLRRHGLRDDPALAGLLSMLIEDTVHGNLDQAPLINAALGATIRGAGLTRARGGTRPRPAWLPSGRRLDLAGPRHRGVCDRQPHRRRSGVEAGKASGPMTSPETLLGTSNEPPPPALATLGRDLLTTSTRRRRLALARPYLGVAAFAFAVWRGWWWLTPLIMFLTFVAVVTVTHDVVHGTLGLGRRATDVALFMLGLVILESGHAYSASHLQHHRIFPHPDDPEGHPADLSVLGAICHGPLFLPRLWYWAIRRPRAKRGWLIAEALPAPLALVTGIALWPAEPGLLVYTAGAIIGSWVYPLLTVHLPSPLRPNAADPHPHAARPDHPRGVSRAHLSPRTPPVSAGPDAPPARTRQKARSLLRRGRRTSVEGAVTGIAISVMNQWRRLLHVGDSRDSVGRGPFTRGAAQ